MEHQDVWPLLNVPDGIHRTVKHIRLARKIVKLEHQDQLAMIGELLAAQEQHTTELRAEFERGMMVSKLNGLND